MGAASPQKRIWLDRRVHAVLYRSAPQIGAPTAWQNGLDGTGVGILRWSRQQAARQRPEGVELVGGEEPPRLAGGRC